VAQYALAKVTNEGLQSLRRAMFGKLLSSRLSLFADQSSSAIANTVVYEVFNGSSMMINAVMKLARDILTLVALVAYLLFLNWKLMLIVSLLFPAVALVIQLLTRRLYRLTKESQVATDNLAYVVEENVLAHRDVRLHGAQEGQASRFEALSNTLRRLSIKSTVAYAGMSAITQVLAAMALSAVISIALLQGSENTTTVGGFVAFVTAMLLLIAPIKSLSDGATPITRGLAALERGLDLVDLIDDESSGAFTKARVAGDIEFSGVSVVYKPDAPPALDNISLAIRAGETVALVGSSGSGKTTLASLLPRFVDFSAGSIRLDGTELAAMGLAVPAVTVRLRQPACRDVQQQHGFQRRAGPVFRTRQGHQLPGGSQPGAIARGIAARHRHGSRPQRHAVVRRPAPAAGDCPGALQGCAGADPGRGHLGAGHGVRKSRPGSHTAAGRGPHLTDHRAPAVYHPACRPHHHDECRPHRGTRKPCGTASNNGAYAHLYRLGSQGAA
jgi:subfamily B ATP-binding cassette protein MsbA